MAAQPKPGDLGWMWLAAPLDPFTVSVGLPFYLLRKGDEQVYPAGTRATAYFNGPLNFDRTVLLKLQPPPYKGPAQVLFNDIGGSDALFCGQVHVGDLTVPLRLKLNPGIYTFSARPDMIYWFHRGKAQPMQLEVHEDHQYWIQRERRGLSIKDIQQQQTEFEIVQNAWRVTDKDLTSSPPQDSCPQAARP